MKIINKIKRLYYHYKHNKTYQKALNRAVKDLSDKIDQEIIKVLVRQIGDYRLCPNCKKGFVPNDRTSDECKELLKDLTNTPK